MAEESKLAEKLKDSTKFSEEEMKTVKEIQQRYVDVQHKLGQLSVAEIRLNQQLDALNITRTELNDTFIKTTSWDINVKCVLVVTQMAQMVDSYPESP